jgi:DNA mismatch repair protein MutS2
MVDNETLTTLEFDKIRNLLAGKTLTKRGRELSLAITPVPNEREINRLLDETTEMTELLRFEEPFPLERIDDIEWILPRLATAGTFLDPSELLKFRDFLSVCGRLRRYVANKTGKYPLLVEYLTAIKPADGVIEAIDSAIDKSGEVKDSASPALRRIRIEKGSTRSKLLSKLENVLRQREPHETRQDDLVTIRDGRYVIPIAEHDFTHQAGVVHDRSKSGATLYVEPLESVELNNRLRQLDADEREEIERILIAIADLARQELPSLNINYEKITEIDLIHARGTLAIDLDAHRPTIVQDARAKLLDAKHPLLLKQAEKKSDVVSLEITIGGKHSVLVVTGPNTGGKTVALKTLGLLILMARSGLHIPASDKSEIGAIHTIFADVGDEQSIELSLSTFSSHLSKIIRAVKKCDSNTLILLDEIGAGTDPKEGAALGEAILAHIVERDALAFVTTHYSALKTLPERYPRIENASLEFDRSTLMPTYRFRTGLPGSSYAIEIAKRLGMPQEIITAAESLTGTQERTLSNLLEKLQEQIDESRETRATLEEENAALDSKLEKLDTRERTLKLREEDLKRKELSEASEIVEDARKKVEQVVRTIRERKADKTVVKAAHDRLREIEKEIVEERKAVEPPHESEPGPLSRGDSVWVETLQTKGELLEYIKNSDSWKVRVGNVISTVKSRFLSRRGENEPAPPLPAGVNYAPYDDTPTQVSVIGMTVEEALSVVDTFLDRVSLSNLESVYILHGKGTGALRRAIKDHLSKHPFVADFRLGYVNEGSSGVTVVYMKRE